MTTQPVTGRTRDFIIWLDRQIYAFSVHWLAFFNLLVFIYVGLPFAAPALMKAGLTVPAKAIYTVYSPLCHQFGFRSMFLFGENVTAPERALTGINPTTCRNVGGQDAQRQRNNGLLVAYCERDVAIYGGILIAGLIFGRSG